MRHTESSTPTKFDNVISEPSQSKKYNIYRRSQLYTQNVLHGPYHGKTRNYFILPAQVRLHYNTRCLRSAKLCSTSGIHRKVGSRILKIPVTSSAQANQWVLWPDARHNSYKNTSHRYWLSWGWRLLFDWPFRVLPPIPNLGRIDAGDVFLAFFNYFKYSII